MTKRNYAGSWDNQSKTWAVFETTEKRVVETGLTRTEAINMAHSLNNSEEESV